MLNMDHLSVPLFTFCLSSRAQLCGDSNAVIIGCAYIKTEQKHSQQKLELYCSFWKNSFCEPTHCYVYISCREALLMGTKCSPVNSLTAMCIFPVGKPSWCEQDVPFDSLLCLQFLLWDPLDGNKMFPLTHCYVYSSCCETLLMETKCSQWLTAMCIVPVVRPSWWEQNVPIDSLLCV